MELEEKIKHAKRNIIVLLIAYVAYVLLETTQSISAGRMPMVLAGLFVVVCLVIAFSNYNTNARKAVFYEKICAIFIIANFIIITISKLIIILVTDIHNILGVSVFEMMFDSWYTVVIAFVVPGFLIWDVMGITEILDENDYPELEDSNMAVKVILVAVLLIHACLVGYQNYDDCNTVSSFVNILTEISEETDEDRLAEIFNELYSYYN